MYRMTLTKTARTSLMRSCMRAIMTSNIIMTKDTPCTEVLTHQSMGGMFLAAIGSRIPSREMVYYICMLGALNLSHLL